MARRKKQITIEEAHPDWEVSYEMKHNGRTIEPKTEISIRGESGRFLFIKYVKTPNCEWIDVIGGKSERYKQFRSFRPEQIKTVHWKNKTRANAA